MEPVSSAQSSRLRLSLVFVYVSLMTLVNGLLVPRRLPGQIWILSDWLINYQGGFVRRGLPGESAFLLSRFLHVSPIPIVIAIYLSAFAIFFVAIWRLALVSSRNFWIYALLLSPASLSFQILHPMAGYRKEILLFAALACFATWLHGERSSKAVISFLLIFVVLGVLSHEGMVFYLPYFLGVLLLSGRGASQACKLFAIPFLAGCLIAILCSRYTGNAQTIAGICSSIGRPYPSTANAICGRGAIPYLIKSREAAGSEVLDLIRNQHYLQVFSPLVFLALLPIFGESFRLWRAGSRRDIRNLWVISGVAFLGSIVLFRYGIDWGRWIYMHIICLTILLIVLDGKMGNPVTHSGKSIWGRPIGRVLAGVLLFVYAFFWALPNNVDESTKLGYFGRLSDSVEHRIHHYTSTLPSEQ